MREVPQLAKGDTVKVYDRNHRHAGQPSGGWDGTVASVGSKYVHIAYPGARGGSEPFDPATRKSQRQPADRWFRTAEEAELSRRLNTALQTLRDAGFKLADNGAAEDVELIEAAAAAVTAVLAARQTQHDQGPAT